MCGLDFTVVVVPKDESLVRLGVHALVVQQAGLPWETYRRVVVGDDAAERHRLGDFISDRFAEVIPPRLGNETSHTYVKCQNPAEGRRCKRHGDATTLAGAKQ